MGILNHPNGFWDLSEEEKVEALAWAMARSDAKLGRWSVGAATALDGLHLHNETHARSKKKTDTAATNAAMEWFDGP